MKEYLIPCDAIVNGKRCMNPINIHDPSTGWWEARQTINGKVYRGICKEHLKGRQGG